MLCFLILPLVSSAQEQSPEDSLKTLLLSDHFTYGPKGFRFSTPDNQFSLQIQSRFQFRYSYPNDENPITFNDFRTDTEHLFKVNRARLKVNGHGYKPWLKYAWEYELVAGVLLDFTVRIEKWEEFNVKVGQWKIDYTRERTVSSGAQQLVDRSILNRVFTVDRQQGVAIYGRLFKGTSADLNYWATVATGSGRGNSNNNNEHLMYVGKIQWNVFGRPVDMTGSDLDFHELPALSFGLAALTNRSQFTRFSTGGGGELSGFTPGDYRINQAMIESALKYKGFSWQHESHTKSIYDKELGTNYTLSGSYFQAGYFFHYAIPGIPENLELAARYSTLLDTNMERRLVKEEEFSTAVNYFFAGHRNKLSLEFAWFEYEDDDMNLEASDKRIRFQWEISF